MKSCMARNEDAAPCSDDPILNLLPVESPIMHNGRWVLPSAVFFAAVFSFFWTRSSGAGWWVGACLADAEEEVLSGSIGGDRFFLGGTPGRPEAATLASLTTSRMWRGTEACRRQLCTKTSNVHPKLIGTQRLTVSSVSNTATVHIYTTGPQI